MEALYSVSGKDSNKQRSIIHRNHTELTNKIARLDEKFIDGDINRETYWQMKGIF